MNHPKWQIYEQVLFSFVGDDVSIKKRYICSVLALKKHKTQKNKEKEKKMSFGEINGEKKCNMLCNNQLCHILSLAQIFSANIGNKTII